ncbi:LADA_0C07822g1_1 [Lachancea dasiensis]|uniref:Altered inheritance of mitochondria protein 41 n=1 Tax=Lachancea dasiensis TaxID=1072105 RepID=A0A1G4IZX3_9SACH|nr:LADA_0C07822g1_1 [Lachancea dasiensis]
MFTSRTLTTGGKFLVPGFRLVRRRVNTQAYVDSIGALKADLKKAMLAKDDLKKTTIRGLLSGIKNKEIDNQGKTLDEFTLHELYTKFITQRSESIQEFEKNNRNELIEREQKEITVIEHYLNQLPVASRAEIDAKVSDFLQELRRKDADLQLKDVFKKVDWKSIPPSWKASAGMIRASIASQFKNVF